MMIEKVRTVLVYVHNTAATSTRGISIYGIHFYIVLTALHLMVRGYCHVIIVDVKLRKTWSKKEMEMEMMMETETETEKGGVTHLFERRIKASAACSEGDWLQQ
jgi:hypothetical protein